MPQSCCHLVAHSFFQSLLYFLVYFFRNSTAEGKHGENIFDVGNCCGQISCLTQIVQMCDMVMSQSHRIMLYSIALQVDMSELVILTSRVGPMKDDIGCQPSTTNP